MVRESVRTLRFIALCIDIILVSMSFYAAYWIAREMRDIDTFDAYRSLVPVLVTIWSFCLVKSHMYQSLRIENIPRIMGIVLKAAGMSFICFTGYVYLAHIEGLSRIFIVAFFVLATASITAEKIVMVAMLHRMRRYGFNPRLVLVVGTGQRMERVIRTIEDHAEWGFQIIGIVEKEKGKVGQKVCGYAVLGALDDIPRLAKEHVIDEAIFVVPRSWLDDIEETMYFLESLGISVVLAADLFGFKIASMKQEQLHGIPFLVFNSTPDRGIQLLIKRLADIVLSFIGLFVSLPLFVIIGLVIRMSSPGPIFFRQKRCGKNGRIFTLYKFRTMVENAEAQLESLKQHNEMEGPVFKMKDDPRITPIGRFLRASSLDELPQLWNVLIGDMSMVGPRPPLPSEVFLYEPWQRRRISMRPGITCIWQVKGRSTITEFEEWTKLDLEYIDNWSLWLDIKLLLQTVPAVLFARGAR